MNARAILKAYKSTILDRLKRLAKAIDNDPAVKKAYLDGYDLKIEFVEPVDTDGQNVVNTFIRGGAIKKSNSKDNIDDQYFMIKAIGENY